MINLTKMSSNNKTALSAWNLFPNFKFLLGFQYVNTTFILFAAKNGFQVQIKSMYSIMVSEILQDVREDVHYVINR